MRANQIAGASRSQARRLMAPSSKSQLTVSVTTRRSPDARRISMNSRLSFHIIDSSVRSPRGARSLLLGRSPELVHVCDLVQIDVDQLASNLFHPTDVKVDNRVLLVIKPEESLRGFKPGFPQGIEQARDIF